MKTARTLDWATWKRKKLWTLVEAACLLAGNEPQPRDAFLHNLQAGGTAVDVYADLKDAFDAGDITGTSRTGKIADVRVEPAAAVNWARKRGISIPLQLNDIANQAREDKPLIERERQTLLIIIAALCKRAGIVPEARGAAVEIEKATQEIGVRVSDDTVRGHLKKIPAALENRNP